MTQNEESFELHIQSILCMACSADVECRQCTHIGSVGRVEACQRALIDVLCKHGSIPPMQADVIADGLQPGLAEIGRLDVGSIVAPRAIDDASWYLFVRNTRSSRDI